MQSSQRFIMSEESKVELKPGMKSPKENHQSEILPSNLLKRFQFKPKDYKVFEALQPHFHAKIGSMIDINEIKYYLYLWIILFSDENLIKHYLTLITPQDLKSTKPLSRILDFDLPKKDWDREIATKILRKNFLKNNMVLTRKTISNLDKLINQIQEECKESNIKIDNFISRIKPKYVLTFLAKSIYSDVNDKNLFDALVFSRHGICQERFEYWLALKKDAGNSDLNLPPDSLFFDSQDLEQKEEKNEGLIFVKVRFDDPRLGVLGLITDCCEHGENEHVREDTILPEVGIVAIVKKYPGWEIMKSTVYLSEECNDANIIGFMRVVQSEDQQHLIIDNLIIKTMQIAKCFKIAKMLSRLPESFLKKNKQYDSIFLGGKFSQHGLDRYFTHQCEDKSITVSRKMKYSETIQMRLISSRKETLYSRLVYEPDYIFRLEASELKPYSAQDIFTLLLEVGSQEHLKHFISLLSPQEFLHLDAMHIGCRAKKKEVIQYLIKNYASMIDEKILALLTFAFEDMQIVIELLALMEATVLKRLLLSRNLENKNNLFYLLLDSKRHDLLIGWILFESKLFTIKELVEELTDNDPSRVKIKFFIKNHSKIFLNFLDKVEPEEIECLLTPSEKEDISEHPPLFACPSLEYFIAIIKRVDRACQKRLILMDKAFEYKDLGNVRHNILINKDPNILSYLLHGSSILSQEDKITLLTRPHDLPLIKNNTILHYNSFILESLQHIFSLNFKTNLLQNLLYAINSKGQTPLEESLSSKSVINLKATEFLFEKMCSDEKQVIEFIKNSGKKIGDAFKEINLLEQGIILINNVLQRKQIKCPLTFFISKETFQDTFPIKPKPHPIYEKLFFVPKLPKKEDKYEISDLLVMTRRALLKINQFPYNEDHNIIFNLMTGLFIQLSDHLSQGPKNMLDIVRQFEERHSSFLKAKFPKYSLLPVDSVYLVVSRFLDHVNNRHHHISITDRLNRSYCSFR